MSSRVKIPIEYSWDQEIDEFFLRTSNLLKKPKAMKPKRTLNWNHALTVLDVDFIRERIIEDYHYLQRFAEYRKHGRPIIVDEQGNIAFSQPGTEWVEREKRAHWSLERVVNDVRQALINRFENKILDESINYIIPGSAQIRLSKLLRLKRDFQENAPLYIEEAFLKFYAIADHEYYIHKNLTLLERYETWRLSESDLDLFIEGLRQGKLYRFPKIPGLKVQRDSEILRNVLIKGVRDSIRNYRMWFIWSRVILPAYKDRRH